VGAGPCDLLLVIVRVLLMRIKKYWWHCHLCVSVVTQIRFQCFNLYLLQRTIWRDKKNINLTMNGGQIRFYLRYWKDFMLTWTIRLRTTTVHFLSLWMTLKTTRIWSFFDVWTFHVTPNYIALSNSRFILTFRYCIYGYCTCTIDAY
jgi:hypothetical protein